MKKLFLIILGLSSMLLADFTKANGVVVDNITMLEWEDNGSMESNATWEEAINYCEALNLNGATDWRLPNFNELSLLVDRSLVDITTAKSALDTVFDDISAIGDNGEDFFYYYWSSTSRNSNKPKAWVVDFRFGMTATPEKKESEWEDIPNSRKGIFYVRCVRGGI